MQGIRMYHWKDGADLEAPKLQMAIYANQKPPMITPTPGDLYPQGSCSGLQKYTYLQKVLSSHFDIKDPNKDLTF